jgi:urease accessory protein
MIAPAASTWHAHLDLQFARRAGIAGGPARTDLVQRRHRGPLMVQKALYPEGPEVCHVAVLHPPGGIAGGDSLTFNASLLDGAHALMLTPGATKWYRGGGRNARQQLRFSVQGAAILEWFPRENIFFDGSQVISSLQVELSEAAKFMGWEVLCFGRQASGESWQRGSLQLNTRITRNGRPVWSENARLAADSGFAASPVGLAGFEVCATFVVAGGAVDPGLLAQCRRITSPEGSRAAVTVLPGVLVARYLGRRSEEANRWFAQLWSTLRPALMLRESRAPRLWAC